MNINRIALALLLIITVPLALAVLLVSLDLWPDIIREMLSGNARQLLRVEGPVDLALLIGSALFLCVPPILIAIWVFGLLKSTTLEEPRTDFIDPSCRLESYSPPDDSRESQGKGTTTH